MSQIKAKIDVPNDVARDTLVIVQRLLGPTAEAADFLGDRVRYYRCRSAVSTLTLAREFADLAGLEPHAVPLKFLVPFLEKASLEEEDGGLTDAWAKLLVAASDDYDVVHQAYLNTLSQLGPTEVEMLGEIVDGGGLGDRKEEFALDMSTIRRSLHDVLEEFLNLDNEGRRLAFSRVTEDLTATITIHYGVFTRIALSIEEGRTFMRENEVMKESESSALLLDNLGLVSFQTTILEEGTWGGQPLILGTVEWIQVTHFGFQFVKTCRGPVERPDGNDLPE